MINIHFFNPKNLLLGLSCACLLSACNQDDTTPAKATEVDSILNELSNSREFDKMVTLIDSFETEGEIPEIDANLKRGWAYHRMRKFNQAE